jgi:uncharacterized membrane protein YczE
MFDVSPTRRYSIDMSTTSAARSTTLEVACRERARLGRRLVTLFSGLILFGASIALMVRSSLGLAPWDVFHQGLARQTGLPLGWVVIGVGAVALLAWGPLGQRPGIGTVSNVVLVGFTIEASLAIFPRPEGVLVRWGLLVGGLLANAVATALYVGAGLGPGPRDGLMMGLARHGLSIRVARGSIEGLVLIVGLLLGGTGGIGTVLYVIVIGPLVECFLPRLASDPDWRFAAHPEVSVRPADRTGFGPDTRRPVGDITSAWERPLLSDPRWLGTRVNR